MKDNETSSEFRLKTLEETVAMLRENALYGYNVMMGNCEIGGLNENYTVKKENKQNRFIKFISTALLEKFKFSKRHSMLPDFEKRKIFDEESKRD